MSDRTLALRDLLSTWPSLEISIELAPWHWRLWFWNDFDCTNSFEAIIGPVKIRFSANRPMWREGEPTAFPLPYPAPAVDETLLRRAIADPGKFTPRGEEYTEPLPSWQARAVLVAFQHEGSRIEA